MKIAFLGWSSLIWCPGSLPITGSWEKDGPLLPIEFARISEDSRLTLVLYPGASYVQTLWAKVAEDVNLNQAVESLRKRENTKTEWIGFVSIPDGYSRCNAVPNALSRIISWAQEKELDAVVWTDLPSNFKCKRQEEFNEENVIKYISELNGDVLKKTKEYIEKAPNQIETKIRGSIRKKLDWDSNLDFFEKVKLAGAIWIYGSIDIEYSKSRKYYKPRIMITMPNPLPYNYQKDSETTKVWPGYDGDFTLEIGTSELVEKRLKEIQPFIDGIEEKQIKLALQIIETNRQKRSDEREHILQTLYKEWKDCRDELERWIDNFLNKYQNRPKGKVPPPTGIWVKAYLMDDSIQKKVRKYRKILGELLYSDKYDFTQRDKVPNKSGLYIIYEKKGDSMLYIGKTSNLQQTLFNDYRSVNMGGSQFWKSLFKKLKTDNEQYISEFIRKKYLFQFIVRSKYLSILEHFFIAVLCPELNK